jgi:hypothetical protein
MLSVFNIKYLKVVSRTYLYLVPLCGGLDDHMDWVSKNGKVPNTGNARRRLWELAGSFVFFFLNKRCDEQMIQWCVSNPASRQDLRSKKSQKNNLVIHWFYYKKIRKNR